MKPKISKKDLFLELAGPIDAQGFSRRVAVSEFKGRRYSRLKLNSGRDWARSDRGLGQTYNVARIKEGKGNCVTHVQLQGFNTNPKRRDIGRRVREAYEGERCRVLDISNVQIDHKDGRYDDRQVADTATQKPDDFQPLAKGVKYAKQQHCKECAASGNRFDARQLGYRVSQVKGDGKYRGTCVGCYWYDPVAFNATYRPPS